jgi:hypothetical protein
MSLHPFVQSRTDMYDSYARGFRQSSDRLCRSQWVLLGPEVADNTNLEVSDGQTRAPARAARGLVYDPRLRSIAQRKLVEPFALQDYNARSEFQRIHRFSILPQVLIEVGSGQYHNNGGPWVMFSEPPNGIRTLEGVQGDQYIAAFILVSLSNTDAMAQLPKYSAIAKGGNLIAVPDIRQHRSNESDLHLLKARIGRLALIRCVRQDQTPS